jgi:hypothetical protein
MPKNCISPMKFSSLSLPSKLKICRENVLVRAKAEGRLNILQFRPHFKENTAFND